MTCPKMGGPKTCTATFTAETAADMMKQGADHLTAMKDDPDHKTAYDMMTAMMSKPEEAEAWNKEFAAKFDALPQE